MSDCKILLTYKDEEGNYKIESVWATKNGNFYSIANIPFFAANLSLGDLVSAEEEDGELYFDKLILPSGHSTVQMIIFENKDLMEIGREIENLGCTWEGSHHKTLISIDIPKDINYSIVKTYLDKGEEEGRWSYKEACIAHNF